MEITELNINTLHTLYHQAIKDGFLLLNDDPPASEIMYQENDFHYNLPNIRINEDGIQSFDLERTSINYTKYFKRNSAYVEIESWSKFREFLLSSEEYLNYLDIGKNSTKGDLLVKIYKDIYTFGKLIETIDYYIHFYKSKKYNYNRVNKLFEQWVTKLYSKKLLFKIWIPLIGIDFDLIQFKFNEDVSLQKIPRNINYSRLLYLDEYEHNREQKKIIGCCKYGLVLDNWSVDNLQEATPRLSFNRLNLNKEFELTVEVLIGLLFVLDNVQTGYYQIVGVPENWSLGYKSNLKLVLSTHISRYPSEISNPYEIYPVSKIKKSQLKTLKKFYNYLSKKLKTKEEKKIQERHKFCLRKLYQANLRVKQADKILDYCIVLESLLTNDSKNEITYRMSTRAAYICKLSELAGYTTFEVKKLIIKLYSLRSSIIHGTSINEIDSKINCKVNNKVYNLISFSQELIKHLFKVYLYHPELQDYDTLEKKILVN